MSSSSSQPSTPTSPTSPPPKKPTTITIEYLAKNCHLQVYEFSHVDPNHPSSCEVCRHRHNPFSYNDVLLGDCYGDRGPTKRSIVICKRCLSKYSKAAGIRGKLIGVQSITTRFYDEQHVLSIVKSVAR